MYRHLLVPIDDSALSRSTVEQALAFAHQMGARVTFVHVRSDFAATSDGAVLHALSPAAYDESAAGVAHGLLAKAEAAARAKNVPFASLVVTSDHVASSIRATARQSGCDLIFMASKGERGLKRWLNGSVTHDVIDGAAIAVLVANSDPHHELSAKEQAIAVLKDEHRSQAAAMRGLLHALESEAPDFALLGALLFYVETFPQRLHHPKEDEVLFKLLRQRTTECNGLLDRLEQQHDEGMADFDRLRGLLDAWRNGDAKAGADFSTVAAAFAQFEWSHMTLEESELLPLAAQHLSDEDWREVANAFSDNRHPHLHNDLEVSYEALFHRLMNLAREASSGRAATD